MITYIIVYSISLLVLSGAVVTLSLLYARRARDAGLRALENRKIPLAGERAFVGLSGANYPVAFLLAHTKTQECAYISPNISDILGVTAEELYADAGCVKRTADPIALKNFRREFREWDKKGTFLFDFPYGENKEARLEAMRAEFEGETYTLFAFRDVTVEKAERAALQSELDEALHTVSERSSFFSNMSHEIRTPMNGIMGMMSIARMNIHDTDRVLACLDKAGELAAFLISVINDILDLSKIESGRMQLYTGDVDFVQLADKMRNMFTGTMQSRGITYTVETVDFTDRVLIGDELRLTQIITNLVSNAQKFTPSGGKVTVTFKQLGLLEGRAQIMIRVRDTGKGISPEAIRKILKPFEQEDASVSHRYGGTGLGLTITDNFVQLMGGNIVIDSELGKGSDFSVFLSLPVSETKEAPHAEAELKEKEFDYHDVRILLAEDNEINAEIAVEILESEGAKVTHAKDGQELCDIFISSPAHSFDLLLVDIQMPRLNGREAAKAIRASAKEDAKSVPMIALSADAFVEDVMKSKAAGMDAHVSKPVDFAELKRTVAEVFATRRT